LASNLSPRPSLLAHYYSYYYIIINALT
jgi:hypothetical protein